MTIITVPLLAIIFLFSGCSENGDPSQNKPESNSPPLSISLNFSRAISDGTNVETVKIKVLQNSALVEEKTVNVNDGLATTDFLNLVPGNYSIEAEAFYDSSLIASGNGSALVVAGENTMIDLSLTFLTGTLTINITYAIPETATFKLTFVSTWSSDTHPTNFPASPHFSGLIGATHNSNIDFWEPGELASVGMQSMAETGSKTELTNEINSAINNNYAGAVLSGGGINPSPNEVSLEFTVNKNFSLISLVSMLAPSPDWFVGVDSVNLIENHMWINSKTLDLNVYDAGTDDGTTFSAANVASDPAQPIETLSEMSTDFDNGTPVIGYFTIEKLN